MTSLCLNNFIAPFMGAIFVCMCQDLSASLGHSAGIRVPPFGLVV